MITTPLDELQRAQKLTEQAETMQREARTRLAEVTARAEQERRDRRAKIWRKQLTEIESTDHPALVRQARADLAASIRGESPVPPVTALYTWAVAEQRADIAHAERRSLQANLGVPESDPRAPRVIDPMRVLAETLQAEVSRTVQAEQDQHRSEVERAWSGEDLPPVTVRLDPSRHLALQGQVQRLRDVITQQEITVGQMIEPMGSDAAMVGRQRDAQRQARADLDAMREALTQAKADLAAFEAGRLT